MAKDPAMLWYWSDWHSGTSLLSRHLKGCYIDILHAQFNNGHLSLEEIRTVLGQDQAAWTVLSKKFKQDSNGLFYNERLDHEKNKREAYTESRRQSRLKGQIKTHDPTYVEHTLQRMENRNENENKDLNSLERGVGENLSYRIEDCLRIALADQRWVKANKTDNAEMNLFNEYLERLGSYEFNPKDYKKYFAKLKGKYPDLLKKEYSIEELRAMAREIDKQNLKVV